MALVCRFGRARSARASAARGRGPGGEPGPVERDPIELLQLHRARDPARGTWQPVMGAIDPGETALDAALRELAEETGLQRETMLGMWALDHAPPFYMHTRDVVVLAPRFCALVDEAWQPKLNHEHDDHRWVAAADAHRHFIWPTQLASVAEITPDLLRGRAPRAGILRVV
jgi:8-oxo-dGTP pyrophosphatase MutT (NUDIX family)